MQLFILDYAPEAAATMLCDVHLRKMCLETSQILSSVLHNRHIAPFPDMPKAYNPAHPVIRALNTPAKINWCIIYNDALHREYTCRFDRTHAYASLCGMYRKILFVPQVPLLPETLDFARNFKDIEISIPDIVEAYREYYRYKKLILRRWQYTRRPEPAWLNKPSAV